MKGFKTYSAAFLTIVWGGIGCFSLLPMNIWQGISLILIGLCFVFSRWALRTSWSGAYKVYVKEKGDRNTFKSVAASIRGK